jgi:hypothetical protein
MKPLSQTYLALILACAAAPFAAVADEMIPPPTPKLGNAAVTIQMGDANLSSVMQMGSGDLAAVFQSGTGLTSSVAQVGNFMGYGLTQLNGKPFGGSFQQSGGNGFTSATVVIQAN